MARPKNPVPSYLLHKTSGQARMRVHGRYVYLGPHGSPESKAEYRRICGELDAAQPAVPEVAAAVLPDDQPAAPPDVTVNEVLLAFWRHAEEHYRRPDGTATNELTEYRQALKPLRALYGHTPAHAFNGRALQVVRREMVRMGLCRTTVNARVRRLKHVFKWAIGDSLVPPAVHQALACVAGLQKGRTKAPEPQPVRPVAEEHVRAVLPFVRPQVRAMVEVQLLTGMRPDEVCRIRPCEVETAGPVWVYRPVQHKNAHRGHGRAIPLGPRAQAVLKEFMPADPAEYFFSPRRAVEQLHAERTRERRTPLYPSHAVRNATKRSANPTRSPGERYNSMSYNHAIARGVERANRERARGAAAAGAAFVPVPAWSANQLRHARATEVRAGYGLEAAQVVLGHARADTTEIYAEKNLALAAKVAAEVG
jgi:integrase